VSERRYFAPCAKGLEYLLRDELLALGATEAREALAGVHFSGDAALGYRACLWSRLASRILLPLAEFEAPDADGLYRGVQGIDWDAHLAPTGTLAIDAHGHTEGLDHTQFAAQRTKDAIVDWFRDRHGERPSVSLDRPDLRLSLLLRRGRGTVSVDLSGGSLVQRGYRRGTGDAPIKENLAAAMLVRGAWPAVHAAGGALVDPMCGSGTLLVEGAWMAGDVAPGLLRERWGFEGWRGHDAETWTRIRGEAEARRTAGLAALRSVLVGSDANAAIIGAARQNAAAAGVAEHIRFEHRVLARCRAPEGAGTGLVLTNPPYGERMGEVEALMPLYQELGSVLAREFSGWRAALITPHPELGLATGLRADRRYALYNGAIACQLLCFDEVRAAPARVPESERPLSAGAQSVANRIAKNEKKLRSWRQREQVACYRVYDADLPEYAAAIDVYESDARWLHVQEYAAPPEIPEETARKRLEDLLRAAGRTLEVPRERIVLKTRRPQTRRERYQQLATRGEFLTVHEGGLALLVNLHDYLDTGLFLDHRPMRARIRALASGRRFLNLFCYTGTASVFAAAGGARTTTSVDLSRVYLDWAARNLAANGAVGESHRLVQADVLEWLAHERGQYDLVYVDPPTWSNSKRAEDFDVQRDHVRLLKLCEARLAPSGRILFSNNFRRFKLDREALAGLEVRDVGKSMLPPDFARDPRIHGVFEITRGVPGRSDPAA